MAKLLAPYSLCPLIEQRRFFGVNEDSSSGCVIVTLGKNIVIRYRLSDQKQVSSWSSRSKLSSSVVYDHSSQKYIGVFNNDEIAFWHDSYTQLNKIKKFRFTWLIKCILSSKDCPAVLVFCNGHVGLLETEFKQRKSHLRTKPDYFLPGEVIKTSKLVLLNGEYYVCIETSLKGAFCKIHFVPIDTDRGTMFNLVLEKEDKQLSAFAVVEGESPQILTLWSDGSLCSEELPPNPDSPEKIVASVNCINSALPAAVLPIGDHHVVLYGAAPNGEGAYLVILSLKFGLPEATQRLKVYGKECRMYSCKNDIMVVSGGHLVVIPYRLGTTRLVSLLGLQRITDKEEKKDKMDVDESLKERIQSLKSEGKTDHMICDQMLPNLIETRDTSGMIDLIDSLPDVADRWLIEMVLFSIETQNDSLLLRLLKVPLVGDESSLDLVRRRIRFEFVLKLLKIISVQISYGEGNKCLLDWASLLLDAHYQQYILSQNGDVIDAVKSVQKSVQEYLECLDVINGLKAEINSLKKDRIDTTKLSIASHSYVFEKIRLY